MDFQDGSVLSSEDLDQNTRQLLFVLQEAYDALRAPPSTTTTTGHAGLLIKNVGPTHDSDDAVTYRQYATDMLPSMQQRQQQAARSEQAARANEQAGRPWKRWRPSDDWLPAQSACGL